jgi:hypothetical protein
VWAFVADCLFEAFAMIDSSVTMHSRIFPWSWALEGTAFALAGFGALAWRLVRHQSRAQVVASFLVWPFVAVCLLLSAAIFVSVTTHWGPSPWGWLGALEAMAFALVGFGALAWGPVRQRNGALGSRGQLSI